MTKVQMIRRQGRVVHLAGAFDIDGHAEGELAVACRRSTRTRAPVTLAGRPYRVLRLHIDKPGAVILEVQTPDDEAP